MFLAGTIALNSTLESCANESKREGDQCPGKAIFKRIAASRSATKATHGSLPVTMAGIIAVLLGGVVMAIGPSLKTSSSLARQASGQPEPAAVRVVGATPSEEVSCQQQTWPNIAQRCLVRSTARSGAEKTSPATPDNAKLSPLTATGNAVAPAPAAPDGTARTIL